MGTETPPEDVDVSLHAPVTTAANAIRSIALSPLEIAVDGCLLGIVLTLCCAQTVRIWSASGHLSSIGISAAPNPVSGCVSLPTIIRRWRPINTSALRGQHPDIDPDDKPSQLILLSLRRFRPRCVGTFSIQDDG